MKNSEKIWLYKRKPINTPYHYAFQINDSKNCPTLLNSLHWHDYLEFEIIYSGESTHIFNGNKYKATRGTAYLLTYTDYHSLHPINENYVQTYNFNFDTQALPEDIANAILNSPYLLQCTFEEEELLFILKEIEYIKNEINKNTDFMSTIYLSNSFTNLIIRFLQRCKECNISVSNNTPPQNILITKAISYIKLHFREQINLKEMSKHIGLSPNYLGKLFLDETGKKYTEYIRDIRLGYAKDLIEYSDYEIYTISRYSGFKSASHFIECFKEKYDITPKQYLKSKNESK